jgi:magnesium chelatase subunit D
MKEREQAADAWADAGLSAALCAISPGDFGGVCIRAGAGPVRDCWLQGFRDLLPQDAPVRRLPANISDDRLIGGLDLVATLRAGRPVPQRGLLAEVDGGLLVVPGAERLGALVAARLAGASETREVTVERDGIAQRVGSSFLMAVLDEGASDEEQAPGALLERLAFIVDLDRATLRDVTRESFSRRDVEAAQRRLADVELPDAIVEALCAAAIALGIGSLRAPSFALRAARALAALEGATAVDAEHASAAARLVYASRATRLPASVQDEAPDASPPPPSESATDDTERVASAPQDLPLDDLVLAAVQSAMPPGLLAQLQISAALRRRATHGGRAGAQKHGGTRGRPAGVRRVAPGRGARINVVETLRAAAPWQAVRRRLRSSEDRASHTPPRVEVRRDDFRVTRYRQKTRTTTIFVVDASGSAALHRLGEAKGAVELLLGECYVRRDRVALLAFRGKGAELVLPPTRSLVRAKRCLAGLPGGGGTPLAAGIDAAAELAEALRRQGDSSVLVFMTDGRANISRDGQPDRAAAEAHALSAARRIRVAAFPAILVDTAPRPQPLAAKVAEEMGARYLPLPNARSTVIDTALRQTGAR